MGRKRHKPEEIVAKLRQVDVLTTQGQSVAEAIRSISERFACRVLGQHRSTQRKIAKTPDDEAALTADIIALALQYGRYG